MLIMEYLPNVERSNKYGNGFSFPIIITRKFVEELTNVACVMCMTDTVNNQLRILHMLHNNYNKL